MAIIIPTKSKLNLLFTTVDSIYEHCNPKLFDVFIADTGSSTEEKEIIRERYSSKNVKLIEYDYYNFAKIAREEGFEDVAKQWTKKNN